MQDFTWPQAVVFIAGIICLACMVISFVIASSGSKFPWED